jgi:dihydrolipoamide dehydrogenase
MTKIRNVDVAIIGAGTAGLTAQREVSKKTDNYLVIDPGPLGTTCARVGCMPSKALIQVANDYARRKVFAEIGIHGAEKLTINHEEVMVHIRKLRDSFTGGVVMDMQKWSDTHFIEDKAVFLNENTLEVGGNRIQAKAIIIATGSKPLILDTWKAYSEYLIDTDSLFELQNLPKRIAVVGLGAVGIELGLALHRLGIETVAIGRGKSIGGLTDPEVQDFTVNLIADEMPLCTVGVESFSKKENSLLIKSSVGTNSVDKALIAIGRPPVLKDLKLENIGVHLDEKGMPPIDCHTFRIDGTNIFVAGDANRRRPFLHEAADEGCIAGYNAVRLEDPIHFKRRAKLSITFSSPNICMVGRTYKELIDENVNFVTGRASFENQGRARIMLQNKGLMHIYVDKKSGKILGAEFIAPEGEHMAHLLAWSIAHNIHLEHILSMPFYHPVLEETLRTALHNAAKQIDHPISAFNLLRMHNPIVC